MAEGLSPIRETLSEITTCPICKGHFRDPKFLPCFHTFCRQCIDTHHQETSRENAAECPLCRRGFVLSLSGAAELPSSFVTSNILDAYKTYFSLGIRHSSSISQCELCDTNKMAANNCDECHRKMCNSCTKVHDKIFNEKHFVYSIKEEESSVIYMKEKENGFVCANHKSPCLKYCNNCSINVCSDCEKTFHVSHNLDILRCEAEDRRRMKCLAEEVKEHVLKSRTYVTSLSKSKQNILNEKEMISRQIEQESEYIQQIVVSNKDQLLTQLEKLATSELQSIETENNEAIEKVNSLTFMFKTAGIFVKEASDVAISAEVPGMLKTWGSILSLNKAKSTPKCFGLAFDSRSDILDKTNVIGNVKKKSDREDNDGYSGVDPEKEVERNVTLSTVYQVIDLQGDLDNGTSEPREEEQAPPLPPRIITSTNATSSVKTFIAEESEISDPEYSNLSYRPSISEVPKVDTNAHQGMKDSASHKMSGTNNFFLILCNITVIQTSTTVRCNGYTSYFVFPTQPLQEK